MSMLVLTRSGRFKADHMIPNATKCAAMRTRTYEYKVRIEGTAQKLSPEGYLLNNEHVQTYFDSRWGAQAPAWDAVSCERMALTSALELCAKVHAEGTDVRLVSVHIKGSNGAWIEAVCGPHDLLGAQTEGESVN